MKIVRFATACCGSLILLVSLVGCSEDEKKAETKESTNSSMTTTKSPTSKKETEKGHASESLDKEKKELYQKKS